MKLEKQAHYQNTNKKYLSGVRALLMELYATAMRGYKIYFRYTAWFIADLITTPIWILVFILPMLMFLPKEQWSNPTTLNFFFWAMIIWDIVGAGLWSFGGAIRREQETGTIEFLFLTNANRIIMFTRSIFTRGLELIIMFIYMSIVFKLLFGIDIILINLPGLILVLLLGLLVAMGFGEIYGALVLRFKNVGPVTNIIEFVILGISGIFFPISKLPKQLITISLLSPFTYIAEMTRYMTMGIKTYIDPHIEMIIIILMAVLFNLIGSLLILYTEKRLKKTGKLGTY